MGFGTSQNREPQVVINASISNAATDLVTTAAMLVKVVAANPNLTLMYLQMFDIPASTVTVGTTAPKYALPLPAGGGVIDDHVHALFFKSSISVAVTTTPTGAVAPGTVCPIEIVYI